MKSERMSFLITQMNEADLEAAATIISRAYAAPPWNEDWSVEAATERVSQLLAAPRRIALAAWDADSLVGITIGTRHRHYAGQLLYLEEVAVLPGAQGAGVGTALLGAIVAAAKAAGCHKVWLVSQRTGRVSEFYRRNGFVSSDKLDIYSKVA
ncbi:putative N-acetyltransferase [Ensifer psoraleae]|uniref:GNAT family N-acetyltransferase n=1 Tax=Sinorhizobium psoraleae TaxID=520838 RepID=UPI0024AC7CAF|nr:GNAT family N-acetyltransferase [Sinorhizobium psoraleae]NRP73743.1 putative N-acetyltransferase [Sinorhizobium psoraleae]